MQEPIRALDVRGYVGNRLRRFRFGTSQTHSFHLTTHDGNAQLLVLGAAKGAAKRWLFLIAA